MLRRVVHERARRLAQAGPALVEEHGAEHRRVELPRMGALAAAPGPAMQEHGGDAAAPPELFEIEHMPRVDAQAAAVERLRGRVSRRFFGRRHRAAFATARGSNCGAARRA